MKKCLLLILIISSFVFAKVDYSEMSTQELIAIMGYVEPENKMKFKKELNLRVPTMTANEKNEYQKNLKKLNK